MSANDKRVYRNRIVLSLVVMVCAGDCQHWICGIAVFTLGFLTLLTSVIDRYL